MPAVPGQTCATCRYVNDRSEVVKGAGECRRYPPQPFQEMRQAQSLDPRQPAAQMVIVGYYPPVIMAQQWCGEWTPALVGANDPGAH